MERGTKQKHCVCKSQLENIQKNNSKLVLVVNQRLLFATRNSISGIDINQPQNTIFPLVSANRENITSMGIYEEKSTIYWADSHSNSIYMLELNASAQTQPRVFIKSG
jgi:hypothetical protein